MSGTSGGTPSLVEAQEHRSPSAPGEVPTDPSSTVVSAGSRRWEPNESDPQHGSPRRSVRRRARWLLRIIGLALLIAILARLDLRQTGRILLSQDVSLLVLGLLMFVPQTALRAGRLGRVLRHGGRRAAPSLLVRSVLVGTFWGTVTPGKVGELAKAGVLREVDASWGWALGVAVVDRLFDVAAVLLLGIVSAMVIGPASWTRELAIALTVIGAACVAAAFVLARPLRKRWRDWLAKAPVIRTYREQLGGEFDGFLRILRGQLVGGLPAPGAVTLVLWLVSHFQVYLFAMAMRMDVSFPYLLATVACGTLLGLLPVSVSGIGTRDAAYIFLLGRRGVSPEAALALSATVLFMFIFNAVVCYVTMVLMGRGRAAAKRR